MINKVFIRPDENDTGQIHEALVRLGGRNSTVNWNYRGGSGAFYIDNDRNIMYSSIPYLESNGYVALTPPYNYHPKFFIRGIENKGNQVIRKLESLGGNNIHDRLGWGIRNFYVITEDFSIACINDDQEQSLLDQGYREIKPKQ